MRSCQSPTCGKPLPAGSSDRKKFCDDLCRKRNDRSLAPPVDADKDADIPTVVAMTRSELADAGRLNTTAGAKALALAARIDSNVDMGSAIAALAKQHSALMAEALDGVRAHADGVDDLKAQAEKRRLRLAGG